MKFIEELKKEKASLEKRLEAINTLLVSYEYSDERNNTETEKKEDKSKEDKSKDDAFPRESSYLERILYIIKKENRFLHNNEIYNILSKYDDKDEKQLKRRISAVLSQGKKEVSNLTNHKIGNSIKNTYWGSKEWIDSDGNILKEHMYNTKFLSKEPRKVFL